MIEMEGTSTTWHNWPPDEPGEYFFRRSMVDEAPIWHVTYEGVPGRIRYHRDGKEQPMPKGWWSKAITRKEGQ